MAVTRTHDYGGDAASTALVGHTTAATDAVQQRLASRYVARHATDPADCAELLRMLGLLAPVHDRPARKVRRRP